MSTATSSDGVAIQFDVHGAGPPLVLVHGLGDDRRLFRPLRERLAHRFTTVALDLRGHGDSSAARDYDPFALYRDVHAVMTTCGIDRPVLIGHSLGGVAVSTAASRLSVAGVINIDQPLDLRLLAAKVRGLGRTLFERPASEITLDILNTIGLGTLDSAVIEQLRASRTRLSSEALQGVWAPLLTSDDDVLRSTIQAIQGIRAPYLAVHGAALPTSTYAQWLAGVIPGAIVEEWQGAGHFPHLTEPERFAARVERFCVAIRSGELGPEGSPSL